MTNIVNLYNPANSASLTPDDLAGLQKLTSEQIKELAKAYPNMTMQRAYLLIIDSSKPVDKQIPAMSSFENLWNLREKNGLRKFVAYNFKGNYKPKAVVSNVGARRSEVLDLSDTELTTLPGFKTKNETFEEVKVPVTKVKRAKKSETKSK